MLFPAMEEEEEEEEALACCTVTDSLNARYEYEFSLGNSYDGCAELKPITVEVENRPRGIRARSGGSFCHTQPVGNARLPRGRLAGLVRCAGRRPSKCT